LASAAIASHSPLTTGRKGHYSFRACKGAVPQRFFQR